MSNLGMQAITIWVTSVWIKNIYIYISKCENVTKLIFRYAKLANEFYYVVYRYYQVYSSCGPKVQLSTRSKQLY